MAWPSSACGPRKGRGSNEGQFALGNGAQKPTLQALRPVAATYLRDLETTALPTARAALGRSTHRVGDHSVPWQGLEGIDRNIINCGYIGGEEIFTATYP